MRTAERRNTRSTELGEVVSGLIHLRPRASAPRIVRHVVYTLCDEAGLPHRFGDDAALVAGELVTASIRQARSDIDVTVEAGPLQVRVGVRDTSDALPMLGFDPRPGPVRSADLVERLSSSWGYCRSDDGRETWALLRLRDRRTSSSTPHTISGNGAVRASWDGASAAVPKTG